MATMSATAVRPLSPIEAQASIHRIYNNCAPYLQKGQTQIFRNLRLELSDTIASPGFKIAKSNQTRFTALVNPNTLARDQITNRLADFLQIEGETRQFF